MISALTMSGAPALWLPWQAILAAAIILGIGIGLALYYAVDRVTFLWGANVREMRHAWWRFRRQP